MEPRIIVEQLKTIPMFRNFIEEHEEELYQVALITREAQYDRGEWLFGQGEISDRFFIILEGKVQLTRVDREGITRNLGTLGPGDTLGETGLLVGDFHDATAEALEPTHVMLILREDFVPLYEKRSQLRDKLILSDEVQRRLSLPKFNWLRDDEWVVMAVQRHWLHLSRKALPSVLMFLALLPVFILLVTSGTKLAIMLSGLTLILMMILLFLILWHFLNWRDDYFILTTQRVAHVERTWPFSEDFEECPLENIQDIHEVRPGLTANMLQYGNLVLQTAGETVQIDMSYVPHPERIREAIFHEIERAQEIDILHTHGAIRELLSHRLEGGEVPPLAETASPPIVPDSKLKVLFAWLRELLFPPSWVVSEDGSTIMLRRFWLPGFFHYLWVIIPMILIAIGGVIFLSKNNNRWMIIVWLLIEAGLFAKLLWIAEDWRNDYFQITPNHLILVDRSPLLMKESRQETVLSHIQNISFSIPGMLPRIFDYGHVMLETAGTLGKFELKWLRHPQKVQAEISKRQREYSQRQKEAEAQRHKEEFLSWFTTYDELRRRQAAQQTVEQATGGE